MNFDKCTIYWTGDFMGNVQKLEARSASVEVKPYAQHRDAVHVRYIKKGGRKERGFVKGYQPRVYIVEGWNQPEPASMFNQVEEMDSGVTVHSSSYTCFDERYVSDFRDLMKAKGVEFDFDSGNADDMANAVPWTPETHGYAGDIG